MAQYSKIFERKARKPYVVAALPRGKFTGFVIKDSKWTDKQIHTAIAKNQNENPSTHYVHKVKVGSFNFVRIESAVDLDDAVEQAKIAGLVFENMDAVRERNLPSLAMVTHRQGRPEPKMPSLDDDILGSLGNGDFFDSLKDMLGRNP